MRKEVQFYSEGGLIKAHLYLPEMAVENSAAVVLCHGFAGIKELLLPAYAEAFVQNGYIALTFDYRGFGESEGERGRLVVADQLKDIRNAITFIQSFKEVDPKRIALWGSSYGGANAMTVAVQDKRVKCLMVQLTFGDGERVVLGNMQDAEKIKLLASLDKVAIKMVTTNRGMNLPLMKILSDEQSKAFFTKNIEEFPQLGVSLPFTTTRETIEHRPELLLKDLKIPIHIVAAENDLVNPVEESKSIYKNANEPKRLVVIQGASHYEVYEGEAFNKCFGEQLKWVKEYL